MVILKKMRGIMARADIYDWLALGLIACLLGLALAYWGKFPVHMDTFYHMGVTSGYSSAGGIALHSFWEFAPAGRPQLYPPLLHVIMFVLTKCGLSTLSAGRVAAFSAFPLLLLTGWYGMRKIFSSRAAFYTTVLLSSCYLLFWHSAVESAASLVMILTPLIFVAVEKNKKVTAAILLALALYSHLTLGHLVALGLLIYAIHRRKMFKEIFEVLLGAYLLWLPWGMHILVNLKSLSFSSPGGGGITVHILIWACALAGFVYCYFKKGRYYLLPSFLLGFIPIVFFYPDRFWNAHVFLPLAMLGGTALSGIHGFLKERAENLTRNRTSRTALVAAAMTIPVLLLLFVDPVYSASGGMRGGPPAMGARVGQSSYTSERLTNNPPAWNGPNGSTGTEVPNMDGGAGTGAPAQPPFSADGVQPPVPPQGSLNAANAMVNPPGPGGMGGPGRDAGLHTTDTTILSLARGSGGVGQQSLNGQALIGSDILELAEIIKENSSSNQIVYAADGSIGNLITGLTGRASTSGMFHEVSSNGGTGGSGVQNAHLLVLSSGRGLVGGQAGLRGMGGPPTQGQVSIDTSDYELVGTVGSYSVYRNKSAAATVGERGTVIPWYLVFAILAAALAAVLIDLFRPKKAREPSNGDGPGSAAGQPGGGPAAAPPAISRYSKVVAIVPCYNEAANVARVVGELRRIAPFVDIAVVDDGSDDGTAETARSSGAFVLRHGRNIGAGAAVRTGMSFALKRGYQFAVQVDGDGQHDPSYIASLLEPLEAHAADVVIGSRFMGTDGYKPPFARRLGTKLLSAVVSAATGQRTQDTTSGFRAMNRRALSFLTTEYPNEYGETESLVSMQRAGITWVEVPVRMRKRASGVSTIRGLGSIRFVARVLVHIALDSVRSRNDKGVPETGLSHSAFQSSAKNHLAEELPVPTSDP